MQPAGREAVRSVVSLEPYRFLGMYVGDRFS